MYIDFFNLEKDVVKNLYEVINKNINDQYSYSNHYDIITTDYNIDYNINKTIKNIVYIIKDNNFIMLSKIKNILEYDIEKRYENEFLFLKYLEEDINDDIFNFFINFSSNYSVLNKIIKNINYFTILSIKNENKFNFLLKKYIKNNVEDLIVRFKIKINSFDIFKLLENIKNTKNIEKEDIFENVNGLKLTIFDNYTKYYKICEKTSYENNINIFCFENFFDKENFEIFFKINDCLYQENSSIQFSACNEKIKKETEKNIIGEINEFLLKKSYFSFFDFLTKNPTYNKKVAINKNKFEFLKNFYNENEIINLL